MMARTVVLLSIIGIILAFPVFADSSSIGNGSTPTRSECIIGFNLDWSEVVADHHTVRNSFGDRPAGEQRIRALAAMTISVDGTRIYLQFKMECEKRLEMAAALIDFWRSEGLDIPVFMRIKDPIIPSPDTIDARGPYWRK